jgi:hypothetical protein
VVLEDKDTACKMDSYKRHGQPARPRVLLLINSRNHLLFAFVKRQELPGGS